MSPYVALALSLLQLASALSDRDKACIAVNAGALDNDFLVGTWYRVYKFSGWLNLPASKSCVIIKMTKATPEDLKKYIDYHGDVEPFEFDETALLYDEYDGYYRGTLTGGDQVKWYALDPDSGFSKNPGYESRVYKKVNEEYLLHYTCAVTGTKWLLSRRRDQTEEELQQVIAAIEEVKRLETQRFCAPT